MVIHRDQVFDMLIAMTSMYQLIREIALPIVLRFVELIELPLHHPLPIPRIVGREHHTIRQQQITIISWAR
jgi:hypothetical protein